MNEFVYSKYEINEMLEINDLGKAYKFMDDNNLLKKTFTLESLTFPDGSKDIPYKYNEGKFIVELKNHVDATYSAYYGGKIQPIEFIMSNAESLDYLRGNVIKYTYRYGAKNGANPEDLYKAAHYLMIMAKYAEEKK